MKPKSCLLQFVFFVILMVVLAASVRRCLTTREGAQPQASAPTVSASLPSVLALLSRGSGDATVAPVATATPDPDRVGIEGLGLPAMRPLLFDIPRVRGIEVADNVLYVASYDAGKKVGMLYQVSQESYTIVQVRTYAEDGFYRLGGLHLGSQLLWTALSADDAGRGSLIVGLDPQQLHIVERFAVPAPIRAVAQAEDGTLIGAGEDGATLYAWGADGALLRQQADSVDVSYEDMDVIRGSLVCAGKGEGDGNVGVIDVLDPASLTLLARHRVYAKSPAGQTVTGRSFGYYEGRFYLLPDQGEFPMVMVYRLEGVPLEDYVPSTSAR
jgi:hypothetical protein